MESMSCEYPDLNDFQFDFDPSFQAPFDFPDLTTPELTMQFDPVVDTLPAPMNPDFSFGSPSDFEPAAFGQTIHPSSLPGPQSAPKPLLPRLQIPPTPEVSRWVPCSPPPGFSRNLPREPSRWVPCSPPPGYPAHPPSGVPTWVPCNPPPRPDGRLIYPQQVARTPFHNPGMSSRLGLQQSSMSPYYAYPPQIPRSVPSQPCYPEVAPTSLPRFTSKPSRLAAAKPVRNWQTANKLSHSNAASNLKYDVQHPIKYRTANRTGRGSIQVEDLCDSDESCDDSASSLSPATLSPNSTISQTSSLGKTMNALIGDKRDSARATNKRKLAEIEESEEGSTSSESHTGDDEFVPKRQCRNIRGLDSVSRRSRRERKQVSFYVED